MPTPISRLRDKLRKELPKGTRIELVSMDDPYSKLQPGDKGTVKFIDDMADIHVHWDCGSSLALVPGEDSYKVLDSVTTICYGEEKHWDNRSEAIKEFQEAMFSTEGAERDRYCAIYAKLLSGQKICSDDSDE